MPSAPIYRTKTGVHVGHRPGWKEDGWVEIGDATLQNAQRTTMTWENLRRARDAYAAAAGEGLREAPLEGSWPAITTPAVMASGHALWGLEIVALPSFVTCRLTFWGAIKGLLQTGRWSREAEVPNPYLPKPGTFYRVRDTLYCREEDYWTLREAARRYP